MPVSQYRRASAIICSIGRVEGVRGVTHAAHDVPSHPDKHPFPPPDSRCCVHGPNHGPCCSRGFHRACGVCGGHRRLRVGQGQGWRHLTARQRWDSRQKKKNQPPTLRCLVRCPNPCHAPSCSFPAAYATYGRELNGFWVMWRGRALDSNFTPPISNVRRRISPYGTEGEGFRAGGWGKDVPRWVNTKSQAEGSF